MSQQRPKTTTSSTPTQQAEPSAAKRRTERALGHFMKAKQRYGRALEKELSRCFVLGYN
ncbi:MAG: hypothetical protein SV765_11005 [Pseudomonadota bacterium]|nr:hypothetical protein [Pseudomonadota bacterium]